MVHVAENISQLVDLIDNTQIIVLPAQEQAMDLQISGLALVWKSRIRSVIQNIYERFDILDVVWGVGYIVSSVIGHVACAKSVFKKAKVE